MIVNNYKTFHRAKALKTGEWIEGFYCRVGYKGHEKNYIIPSYASAFYGIEIDARTLCRSFMYEDDSGHTIYDKDIVEFQSESVNVPVGNGKFQKRQGHIERYLVQWIDEGQEFVATPLEAGDDIDGRAETYFCNFTRVNCPFSSFIPMLQDVYGDFRPEYGGHTKIIGNIFDNPELLKGAK